MFISLIVSLIVLGLFYWLVTLIPLPSPFPEIIKVVFVIVDVLIVLQAFGVHTGVPIFHFNK